VLNAYYNHDVSDFSDIITHNNEHYHRLFQQFKNDIHHKKHPILNTIHDTETFNKIDDFKKTHIKQIEKCKTFIILGTGGSSLGARAMTSWLGFNPNILLNKSDINFIALDNLDDISFAQLLEKIDFETTYFLIISKSGNTLETNVQAQTLFNLLKTQNKTQLISQNIAIITEISPNKNNFVKIAEHYNIPLLPHSLVIGGRYSALTMTGLLPAYLVGIDYKAILSGTKSVIDELLQADNFYASKPCLGATALIGSEQQKHLLTHIFAGYGDRFSEFATWIRQLWAESLGKQSKGGLFVPSINPLDQHSQLQMYYDGIDNKTYSFIECHLKNTQKTHLNFDANSPFSYLNDKTIHDVVHASYVGTIESLRSKGRLIRTLSIDDYTPEALGALMMHFIIETIFASYILEVNPYDQPAVEDYKHRTQALLR
jgi:glucose-6-phosphate isomerase